MKPFTLVSTVFNENKRLQYTIEDLEAQELKPDQIVITDAGSTDGTFEALQRWARSSEIKIHVLQKKKCNVAEGRNLAIRYADHHLIVSTDFGCRFHTGWLKSMLKPFNDESIKVVGGAFSVEESGILSIASRANYILSNGYKVELNDSFIPSSRSIAYYKSIWESVGGYCEWLTLAADDLVFGKAIRAKGYQIFVVYEPYVLWGRHETLNGYAKEAFRYGLGDGEARVNVRNAISTVAELILRYLLFVGLTLLIVNFFVPITKPVYFLPAIIFLPGLRSYYHSFRNWMSLGSLKYDWKVLLYSFRLIEITRCNYIKGFIKGYFLSSSPVKEKAKELGHIIQ